MNKRIPIPAALVAFVVLAIGADAASSPQEHSLKVGKRGELVLKQKMKVGNTTLPAGTYFVQHRAADGGHSIRFTRISRVEDRQTPRRSANSGHLELSEAAQVLCYTEPAPQPVKATTVYTIVDAGAPRITKVAIKGETVVHVF